MSKLQPATSRSRLRYTSLAEEGEEPFQLRFVGLATVFANLKGLGVLDFVRRILSVEVGQLGAMPAGDVPRPFVKAGPALRFAHFLFLRLARNELRRAVRAALVELR